MRLCKILKGGGFQGGSNSKSAPLKSMIGGSKTTTTASVVQSSDSTEEDDTQICAIKILSKHAIIKAKQVDHVFNEMALQ